MNSTNITEKLTDNVLAAYGNIENPRTQQIMKSLIQHLHGFIKDIQLSEPEWEYAWDFLARMAQFTSKDRNEFLLMADVLGASQLIEIMNHQRPSNSVGYALGGPFYRANAPLRARGTCTASDETTGKRVIITGTVINLADGKPISNATLDVWQAATNGFYENQDPAQPNMNLRGKFKTDDKGTYELIALLPTPYPVPTDGPVGELLRTAKRHPLRPAHIHFVVSAPEHETLVTQVFMADDEIIHTDAVFTASDNMVGNFIKDGDHYRLNYDFQLAEGESICPKAPIP